MNGEHSCEGLHLTYTHTVSAFVTTEILSSITSPSSTTVISAGDSSEGSPRAHSVGLSAEKTMASC